MVIPVYIIRFLSGVLLMIFALSITPKRFLHAAFAKHVDDSCRKTNKHPFQLGVSGYTCDNDNQVAESAFESVYQSFSFPFPLSFPSYVVKDISFSSITEIYSSLRGPPAKI